MPQTETSVEIVYIDKAKALHEAVHRLRQQPSCTSRTIDTETTGVVPFLHRIKVVQIGVEGIPVYVLQIERIPENEWGPLREYFAETRPNILQNAKFDLKMLEAEGLPLIGTIHDTMLRSKLYHLGNRKIDHGLKSLAFKWCEIHLDKTQQTSFVADDSRQTLTQAQISYAAVDITTTSKVHAKLTIRILEQEQKQTGILRHIEREERFLPLLAKLENQGIFVDLAAVETLETVIKCEMESIETQLAPVLRPHLQQLKLKLGRKSAFVPTKLLEAQIKDAFQLEDAETKTLLRAAHQQTLVKLVMQHEVLWRLLSCCKDLRKRQHTSTRKWHPDHTQIENLQGSLGPSKLKIELLERLTESWRQTPLQLLRPASGCELLKISFPELELALLAHYAQEPQLQKELADGESPITLLASAIATARLSVEPYDNNFLAKVLWQGNGILNQKGIYLQTWLLSEYGLILDSPQVKALQTLIPTKYPALTPFHAGLSTSYYGKRTTILGGLRLWDESSPKDVRNFVIWSSFNELLKECVSYVQPCCAQTNGRVAFLGEQSLVLEVPETTTTEVTAAVLNTLVEKLGSHCPQIAINIEISSLAK